MNNTSKIPPIFVALTIQVFAFLILYLSLPQIEIQFNLIIPVIFKVLAQGMIAAFGSYCLKQSYWWILIQVFFPLLLLMALRVDAPIWIFPIIIVLLAAVFWNVVFNRVPLYLTNDKTARKLLTIIPKTKGLKFVDLGSGLANTIRDLAVERPFQTFYGYETAPGPYVLSWLLTRFKGLRNVHLRLTSIWNTNLAEYDVVYCFLSPVPMQRLYEKAKAEMKPGSLFISNSFVVPDEKPDRTVTVSDSRKTKLMIWKI